MNLYQSNIEKVTDNRHSKGANFHNDDYEQILIKVLESDIIIFSTPLYWYSMSASLKLFIDRWTESLRDTQIDNFKEIMSQKKVFDFNHRWRQSAYQSTTFSQPIQINI